MFTQKIPISKLYRQILKALAKYPSIKRNALIKETKEEFHRNKNLTNQKIIDERYQAAVRSLEDLKKYVELDKKSDEWSIHLRGGCP